LKFGFWTNGQHPARQNTLIVLSIRQVIIRHDSASLTPQLMAEIRLVLVDQPFCVPMVHLVTYCETFQTDPALLTASYDVRSRVNVDIFALFVGALRGSTPEITAANATGPTHYAMSLAALHRQRWFLMSRIMMSMSDETSAISQPGSWNNIMRLPERGRMASSNVREFNARRDRKLRQLNE
jgi:hypothetical protein